MTLFIEQSRWYANAHQTANNHYCHFIGIPLLILSAMIFLGFIHLAIPGIFDIKISSIATVVLLVYYYRLQWKLALLLTPVMIFLLWIADLFSAAEPSRFSLWSLAIIFLLSVIFLALGHLLEGKRPAFLDNFRQSLIAPLFLTAEVVFLAGKMHYLRAEMYGHKTTPTHLI